MKRPLLLPGRGLFFLKSGHQTISLLLGFLFLFCFIKKKKLFLFLLFFPLIIGTKLVSTTKVVRTLPRHVPSRQICTAHWVLHFSDWADGESGGTSGRAVRLLFSDPLRHFGRRQGFACKRSAFSVQVFSFPLLRFGSRTGGIHYTSSPGSFSFWIRVTSSSALASMSTLITNSHERQRSVQEMLKNAAKL